MKKLLLPCGHMGLRTWCHLLLLSRPQAGSCIRSAAVRTQIRLGYWCCRLKSSLLSQCTNPKFSTPDPNSITYGNVKILEQNTNWLPSAKDKHEQINKARKVQRNITAYLQGKHIGFKSFTTGFMFLVLNKLFRCQRK